MKKNRLFHEISDFLSDLFVWWSVEIKAVTARLLRSQTKSRRAASLIISVERDECRILGTEGVFTVNELSERLTRAKVDNAKSRDVQLLLHENRFLGRRISGPRLPNSKARKLCEIDFTAQTPLQSEKIYLFTGYADPLERSLSYYLVRRDILDPILEQIRAAGMIVRSIRMAKRADLTVCSIMPIADHKMYRRELFASRASIGLFLAGLLALATSWLILENRLNQVQNEYEAALVSSSAMAKKAKVEIDNYQKGVRQIAELRLRKRNGVSIVSLLEELSAIIPDANYLTDFSFDHGRVIINGFSNSASELIPILDARPLLRNVEFAGPVTRVPGYDGDQFSLRMKVGADD